MKSFENIKLIYKLTIPIIVIVLAVFISIVPFILNIVDQSLKERLHEELAHLSALTDMHFDNQKDELRRDMQMLSDMPAIKSALETEDAEELMQYLREIRVGLRLDFVAAIKSDRSVLQFVGEERSLLNEVLPKKFIDRGMGGENFSTVSMLDGRIYTVGIASGMLGNGVNFILAARELSAPVIPGSEAYQEKHKILFYGLDGMAITPVNVNVGSHMYVSPSIVKQIVSGAASYVEMVQHDEAPSDGGHAGDHQEDEGHGDHHGSGADTALDHMMRYAPIFSHGDIVAIYTIHASMNKFVIARKEIASTILGIMGIGILLMILTGFFTSRWVSRRIESLLKGTQAISQGNLGYQLSDSYDDEIGELAQSFDEMSSRLAMSHSWWSDTFNSMSDAISIHDTNGIVLQANQALVALLGVPMDMIIGKKCHDIFHGTGKCVSGCPWQKCIQSESCEEEEMYDSENNRWLAFSASPIFNDKKIDSIIHVVRNITVRKQSESLLQLQLKRLDVVHSIEKAISSSLDLSSTLDHLVSQVTSQLGIDAASVLMMNEYNNTLEYVVSKGLRSGALRHTRLPIGEGYAGRAASSKQIISVSDLREAPGGFTASTEFEKEGFVTYCAVPLISKGELKGVMELFHRSSLNTDIDWLDFLDTIADQAAGAIDVATLFNKLQQSRNELILAYDSTLIGWSRAMDMRDKETEGHSRRVTELTVNMAVEFGIQDHELMHIRRGALLHDIGKIGIPDSILLKPSKLTEDEWVIMKLHPNYAYEMLNEIEYLQPCLDIPYCHHEKWDGSGYPQGLKGKEIPHSARILAVI
ncbi:HD domain-containing protein [bacterium]|nr:HD domain-containing protein [bacterium]